MKPLLKSDIECMSWHGRWVMIWGMIGISYYYERVHGFNLRNDPEFLKIWDKW